MRIKNYTLLTDVSTNVNTTVPAINVDGAKGISFQCSFSGNAQSVFTAYVSNDTKDQTVANLPVNLSVLDGATLSGAGVETVNLDPFCGEWIQPVFVCNSYGIQTIETVADASVNQVSQIGCISDAAEQLWGYYFLISSLNTITKTQKNWYVWFNPDGVATDPALPGKTGIQIPYLSPKSAGQIATLVASALNALTDDFTASAGGGGGGSFVTATNLLAGPVTQVANGFPSDSAMTFTTPTPGVASQINNTYFYLYSALDATAYYVWANVDGLGTDPGPFSGKTGVEVAFGPGIDDHAVANAYTAVIDAINTHFSVTDLANVVTITNIDRGIFTPIVDINSPFTFAVTTPAGTIDSLTIKINLG